VTRPVPDYALVSGVPAKQMGWISRAGERLGDDLTCPRTGERYEKVGTSGLVLADGDRRSAEPVAGAASD
jgi:UDP-2-acetamido-3-amino-2,3-dideoxy-glucuronate N-acetyltransferase